ncbi:MAG: flagellar FlbD family protein [Spirochaetaceae bacterium]|jgi:flagellar protein FlbD|nr:flagellar FlbD family protein [Spirochaetaceae bacterium]
MIKVTMEGKNSRVIYLNPHQIEYIEFDEKTAIILLSGKRLIALETPEELIHRIVDYRSRLGQWSNEE